MQVAVQASVVVGSGPGLLLVACWDTFLETETAMALAHTTDHNIDPLLGVAPPGEGLVHPGQVALVSHLLVQAPGLHQGLEEQRGDKFGVTIVTNSITIFFILKDEVALCPKIFKC